MVGGDSSWLGIGLAEEYTGTPQLHFGDKLSIFRVYSCNIEEILILLAKSSERIGCILFIRRNNQSNLPPIKQIPHLPWRFNPHHVNFHLALNKLLKSSNRIVKV